MVVSGIVVVALFAPSEPVVAAPVEAPEVVAPEAAAPAPAPAPGPAEVQPADPPAAEPTTPDTFAAPPQDVDDGKFEIGGFMKRPPPKKPIPPAPEPVEAPAPLESTRSSSLVWGLHDPVAPWKRKGLVVSAVMTGAGALMAAASYRVGQSRLHRVDNRVQQLVRRDSFFSTKSVIACAQNEEGQSGNVTLVRDTELAMRCASFERARLAYGISLGVAIVGAVSTVTFGILHSVRRVDHPRRVQARADGVAVRF